jgi:hypothetical protein
MPGSFVYIFSAYGPPVAKVKATLEEVAERLGFCFEREKEQVQKPARKKKARSHNKSDKEA